MSTAATKMVEKSSPRPDSAYKLKTPPGWKGRQDYWVSSDAWRKEIHAGNDGKSAARVLRDVDLLVEDKNRGARLTRRGPRAIDRVQCYYVKKAVLATEQGV